MFGRHIQVRFARNKQNSNEETTQNNRPDLNDIVEATERLAKGLVVGVVVVMGTAFVLGMAEHLIVNATQKVPLN